MKKETKYFNPKVKKLVTDYISYFDNIGDTDIVISEDIDVFKKGQIIKEYRNCSNGIMIEKKFISSNYYKRLDEKLSKEDEKDIKDLIQQFFKYFIWNLYTKQSILIKN